MLAALNTGLQSQPFLFGSRPSLADFGLFGQLQILSVDPTPAAIMRETAPHVFTWLMRLDDASGVEGEWQSSDAPRTPMVIDLLRLAGEAYLPFLRANAEAIDNARDSLSVTIFGIQFDQVPFRYQAKCWSRLCADFAGLEQAARSRIEPILAETGCLPM